MSPMPFPRPRLCPRLLAGVVLLIYTAPAGADPLPLTKEEQTRIDQAIDKGVEFLKGAQSERGDFKWRMYRDGRFLAAQCALPAYALLESGVPAGDPVIQKVADFLRNGIHLLVVDPFPPGPRDPDGVAQAIWDELVGEPLATRPTYELLTVAAFDAGERLTAYVDCPAVGDPWPEAPLFLAPGWYVNVPLEETYRTSWAVTPRPIRDLLDTPATEPRPAM